jgi:hypothetical protein
MQTEECRLKMDAPPPSFYSLHSSFFSLQSSFWTAQAAPREVAGHGHRNGIQNASHALHRSQRDQLAGDLLAS